MHKRTTVREKFGSGKTGFAIRKYPLPYSALDGSPGCWNFRLEAVNGNGLQCEFSDLAEGTVEVLQLPDVNFNIQDINGNTLLHVAIWYQPNVIRLLLNHGIDVNLSNNKGVSAILVASEYGYFDIVKDLVSFGSDVNTQNNDGLTPLMIASRRGDIEIVEFLLGKGAYVDAKNYVNNWTSLTSAITSKNYQLEIIKIHKALSLRKKKHKSKKGKKGRGVSKSNKG